MAAANFDDCCAQLCATLDLEPPPLLADENGERAFTITYRKTDFSFIERKRRGHDSMSMLVKFGVPPQDKAFEVLAGLLAANYRMMDEGGAAFNLIAETGEIHLHRLIPLARLHVPGLVPVMDEFAAQVARWPDEFFCASDADMPADGFGIANLA
ncbi:MAG TPA: CesT family type III secretion system chaperone [Ramlibacter sp.]|uniref:CesT family type III secretion system chaperone n=1 Tax=Ramlibacter sp. TaxID=1917967 RepID=UPI002C685E67|nr:CesT family type III secretion system chaperone [Ramlibacter sp.]HVZ42353.1 CesT family type III secretion system chaperone [Ramlibacter sp.]